MQSYISSVPEQVNLKSEPTEKPKEFKVDRPTLSENIQAFDKKPRVFTKNPFGYEEVRKGSQQTPTSDQMIATPLYNTVGKMLGVDVVHNWGMDYDKVYEITQLAKEKTGIKNEEKLQQWIYKKAQSIPNVSGKKITDLLMYLKLMNNEPKTKPKVIIKTVIKYRDRKPEPVINPLFYYGN